MLANQKRWNQRFGFMKKKNNKILELGCYRGEMSKWFSDNLLNNQNSRLYCVDTKKKFNDDKDEIRKDFKKNIKKSKFPNKVKVFKNTTNDFLITFLKRKKQPIFNLHKCFTKYSKFNI